MAAPRHRILYDLDPWQRVRKKLGLAIVGVFAVSAVVRSLFPKSDIWNLIGLLAFVLLGVALGMGLRSRFSYVRASGNRVVIRVAWRRLRLDSASVLGVHVAPLGKFYKGAERNQLPRPHGVWVSLPAIAMRVDPEHIGVARLTKKLGTRPVCGQELVFPVVGAGELRDQIAATLATPTVDNGSFPAVYEPSPSKRKRRPGR